MIKPFIKYQAINFKDGIGKKIEDSIAVEKALQISINGNPFSVVMQTPGDEVELVQGLLYSEDVISSGTKIDFEKKRSNDGFVEVVNCVIPKNEIGEGYKSSRSLLSVSSCGICGKQSLDDINVKGDKIKSGQFNEKVIHNLINELKNNQPIFSETGAVHGSALFNLKNELLVVKEDVGRHNSLDKAVGDLLLNNKLKEAKILAFSGRLSFEIIFKAFRSKIPVIIAVSAPTTLAIDYAKEFGITLYGFTRSNRYTKYS